MRVVAILGRAFSGSTVMSRALNTVPGVAALGELHTIVDGMRHDPSIRPRCAPCGILEKECDVFTTAWLQRAQSLANHEVYQAAMLRYRRTVDPRAGVLVTNDKNLPSIERFTVVAEMDAIVMIKAPADFVASDKARGFEIERAVDRTYNWFRRREWAQVRRHVVVDLARFVDHPRETLRQVCALLDLAEPSLRGRTFVDVNYHSLAGNLRAQRAASLDPSLPRRAQLTQDEEAAVAAHDGLRDAYASLLRTALD